MKQLFTLFTLATMLLFASCEKANNSSPRFTITSGIEYMVDVNGGDIYVTYTGANAVSTTIKSGPEAINSIKNPTVGVVVVNFRANATGAIRNSVVEVRANDDIATLVFLQAGSNNGGGNNGGNADVTFAAQSMDGYYYGEKYGQGTDRYAFFLSDKGLNNGGQAYTDGTYYYIDCFSPATKSTSLPLGTYTFDSSNDGSTGGVAYSITNNSQLILTTDNVETSQSIKMTDATMTVSANSITLVATINGEVHKVTFNGDLSLEDVSEENGNDGGDDDITGGQDGEAQSTLTTDRHVTFDGEHRAKWGYEGDYWQTGYSNYTIYIMNKSGGYVYGDTLQFDLITDNKSSDGKFAGKYTISNTPGKMVMVAGFTNKYAQAVGSWFYEYGGGSASGYKNYAMIKSGSAEFIDNGDGTHTVILDGYDYKGNNITCNWTGVIEKD